MVRLRIALGVASALVAVAALTVVFAGTGEAQGNGNGQPNGPNVFVTNTPLPVSGNVSATIANTPLPVTGNVTATMSGNVSAMIINPAASPVLIRDVDAQGAKELWQQNESLLINNGQIGGVIPLGSTPAGKALVIEHVHLLLTDQTTPEFLMIDSLSRFGGGSGGNDFQAFAPQVIPGRFVVNEQTKFYVPPNTAVRATVQRSSSVGNAGFGAVVTGYLINYP